MKLPLIVLVYMITTVAAQTTSTYEKCGNTSYYGPSGVITSPNYPGNYSNTLNCNYYIYASTNKTTNLLSITFQSFNMEQCASGCDYVKVSCASDPSFIPRTFSGTSLPSDILIVGCNVGLVHLYTGLYVVRTGFQLTYNFTEEVATVCGTTLHGGASGVISSPNYPGNYYDDLNCDYNIYASTGSSFTLTFKSFDVEDGYDFVTVSCATNSSFPTQSYSGRSLPAAVSIPWCSQGLVSFRTDSSTVSSGFSLSYYLSNGGCGNTAYTGPSGYVTSPHYPAYYGKNHNCSNIIWAPERSTFYLEFESFYLETSCTYDWLEIRCIDNSEYGRYKLCGYYPFSPQSMYFHECSQVLLVFRSDLTSNQQGFKLQYNVYPNSETTTVAGIPGYTQTTPAPTPEPACGYENHYESSGVITSPNYPGNYYNNLNCTYYIYTTRGSTLSIFFKDFYLPDNYDHLMIECPNNSSFPMKWYIGQMLPKPLAVWCTKTSLRFQTNSNLVSSGFSFDYYVSDGGQCGNTVYNATGGNVMSPNYPSNYSNYQNCSNIIWAPQRSHFRLNFLIFELQECGVCPGDWVEVSCLDNNPSDKHRFCGTINYPLDFYQCSQVLVWFHSDGSDNNYKGFNLEYYVDSESENTTVPETTNLPQTTQTPPVPTPEPGCDVFHCEPSGTITSPNYPGNYHDSLKCNHYIQASTGSSITFVFQHFDLEDDKDYIIISCLTNSSFPEQRYSGHTLPPPLSIPWCSQGSVYFNADTDTVYSGFSIDYYVSDEDCGDTVYTESIGNVTSPKYPSNFGFNQNCRNIILAPQRSQFHIQFQYISMDTCPPCLCDFVEISCLDNNTADRYRSCGDNEMSLDLHQCTQVLVWFHSDGENNYKGFDLDYNFSPEQGCGEASYYGPSGVISSPGNDAGFYLDSLYCDYNIYTASSSGSIAIIYQTFNTEECCDHVTVSCPTNSSFPAATYSGSSLPQPISIPWCSQGRVSFESDSSVSSTGFSLEYHTSLGGCGDTLYSGSQGYVSSPHYPNAYGVSHSCSNIILAYKPTSFDVSFLHLDLEECCDFVELSCLDNPEYGTHRFTGDSIPPTQYIPQCTKVLVWFYTDDSNEYTGFNLEYSINSGLADRKALDNGQPNAGEKLPSDEKRNSGETVLNKEKHNGGEKVPGDGKPAFREKVLNKEKQNAGEKVPSDGKPKEARK